MDIEIDSNENRVGTAETNINSNDSDIATLDSRVDSNENRVGTAETNINSNDSDIAGNDSDIATLDSRVDSNENEINQIDGNHDGKVDNADNADDAVNVTSTYKGNDIDTNGDGKVDNADRLNGKRWVTIASGNKSDTTNFVISLKPRGTHNHYNISAYSNNHIIYFGRPDSPAHYAYLSKSSSYSSNDGLYFVGDYSNDTVYYEVWSWE
jgi:hypothetical protein